MASLPLLLALLSLSIAVSALDNGLARTPPMVRLHSGGRRSRLRRSLLIHCCSRSFLHILLFIRPCTLTDSQKGWSTWNLFKVSALFTDIY